MPITLDGTNGVFLPSWTTATRPASPANGEIGYNSTTGQIDQYVGGAWSSVPTGSGAVNSGTAYQLAYYAASGTVVSTLGSLGTNGQVLTSGGAGVAPSWAAPSVTVASPTARGVIFGYSDTQGATGQLFTGYLAGANSTGSYNVGSGYRALYTNVSGASNVAIGALALELNTASYNTAVGHQALNSNITSNYNTAVGYQAGQKMTGLYNTAIGALSIQANTSSGDYNTALGTYALLSLNGGSNNSSVGYGALSSVTIGVSNTAIGHVAGNTLTTGSNNIYIGTATVSAVAVTYEIVIGNGTTGKGGSTAFISPAGGGVYQGNNTSTWSVISDQRLKKNIVENTVGLESINAIRVCNFEYRTEDEVTDLPKSQAINKQGVQLGAIAQELQAILPDCVKEQSTGVLSVNSDSIMWHMINAIKELSAEVNALKARLGA